MYQLLSVWFQGVKRLFVLAYFISAGAPNNDAGTKYNRKFFLPRGEIKKDNVLIDERNFCDQPIMTK